jgi:hypothetical protein
MLRFTVTTMQWINNLLDFVLAPENRTTIIATGFLFLALVFGLLVGGLVSNSASKRFLRAHEDQAKANVIAALVDVATEASVWNSLTPQEQVLSDRAVGQIDVRVRLLTTRGSNTAADWAAHQLAEMKRNSATFGYQLDPAVGEFRDRLILWQRNPAKANKIFASDLDRWSYTTTSPEAAVVAAQDAWVAQQHAEASTPPAPQPENGSAAL